MSEPLWLARARAHIQMHAADGLVTVTAPT